jgi:hypothetical protein
VWVATICRGPQGGVNSEPGQRAAGGDPEEAPLGSAPPPSPLRTSPGDPLGGLPGFRGRGKGLNQPHQPSPLHVGVARTRSGRTLRKGRPDAAVRSPRGRHTGSRSNAQMSGGSFTLGNGEEVGPHRHMPNTICSQPAMHRQRRRAWTGCPHPNVPGRDTSSPRGQRRRRAGSVRVQAAPRASHPLRGDPDPW